MPFIHRADAQQAFAECQAKPWHLTVATHLEPSFRVDTNHPLFYGLLQLFLLVFFIFCFYFSFFSFNRPQEGENCWSRANIDLLLALGAKGHWAARFCKQRIANVFGVLGTSMWYPDSGLDSSFAWPSHIGPEPDCILLWAGL